MAKRHRQGAIERAYKSRQPLVRLSAPVRRHKGAPSRAVRAAAAIEERSRDNPRWQRIEIGYGGWRRERRQGAWERRWAGNMEATSIAKLGGLCRSDALRAVKWLADNGYIDVARGGGRIGVTAGAANSYAGGPKLGVAPAPPREDQLDAEEERQRSENERKVREWLERGKPEGSARDGP